MKNSRSKWFKASSTIEDIEEVTGSDSVRSAQLIERRKHQRLSAPQHVAVQFKGGRAICDLIDLSSKGARLRIVDGHVPEAADRISITLLNDTTVSGRVEWLGSNSIGVALDAEIKDIESLLMFEDLGEGYYGAALRLQQKSRRDK